MSDAPPTTRVLLDVDKCIGAGQCVRAAPTVFAQNEDDGIAYLLQEEIGAELVEATKTAERWCPARAIAMGAGAPKMPG